MKTKTILSIIALSLLATAAIPERELLEGVQPGPDGSIDVVTIFAHQDDESVYGGGTLLKIKRDPSVRLWLLCLTLGDASEAKDKLKIDPDRLARIRSAELRTAAAVYQAEDVFQFQYHDQGLASADPDRIVAEIVAVLDRVGAEVVLTHDPAGITSHPDHIACSRYATQAFAESHAGALFYVTYPRRFYALTSGLAKFGGSSGQALPQPAYPDFKVDIHQQKKLKRLACYAHASQKHFSLVGVAMDFELRFNHEYWAAGQTKE